MHKDGDGALSAGSGSGGNSIEAPDRSPWYGSFGNFILCADVPDAGIVLDGVRVISSPEPLEVFPVVRTLTPEQAADETRKGRLYPFYTSWGRPPDFSEPYADMKLTGDFSTSIDGLQVSQTCDDSDAARAALDSGLIQDAIMELIFVMKVDSTGGRVSNVYIDYRANDEPYSLRLRWVMAACGSAIRNRDVCPKSAPRPDAP